MWHVQHLLRYFGSTSDVKGALNHPGIVFGWLPIMCAVCGGASLEVVAYMLEQNKTESLAFRSATDGPSRRPREFCTATSKIAGVLESNGTVAMR